MSVVGNQFQHSQLELPVLHTELLQLPDNKCLLKKTIKHDCQSLEPMKPLVKPQVYFNLPAKVQYDYWAITTPHNPLYVQH